MRLNKPTRDLPTVQRGRPVVVHLDGRPVKAFDGETVAAVLLAEGIHTLRHTAKDNQPRSLFCGMGICFDCLVTVDGRHNIRACVTPVADGMKIETQDEVQS